MLKFSIGGVIVILAVWALLVIVRRLPIGRGLHETNDVVGFYITIIGTIYAVVLAFILSTIWQQFDNVDQTVNREANAATNIYLMADGLSEPLRTRIHDEIRIYVQAVVREEWPALQRGETRPILNAHFDGLWKLLLRAEPRVPREKTIVSMILTQFTEMAALRRSRLLEANKTLPDIVWMLQVFGGCMTVGFSSLFGVQKLSLHLFKAGMLALVVYAMLFTIWELDLPFQRDVTISSHAFEDALERFDSPSYNSS